MPNALIRKLKHGAALTDGDRSYLEELCKPVRHVGAHQDIIAEGEAPEAVHLVLSGLACRYKLMPDGTRQNMAFLIPGDFCDLHVAILGKMDHAIGTLTPCTMVDIPRSTILAVTERHPRITHALWWCTLVDEGTLREWLVNMTRRAADQRMAHLMCELLVRMQAVGLADHDSYDLPITQTTMAETLGISPIHANRMVRDLREAGLIEWTGRRLRLPDVKSFKEFCGFDPAYLHLRDRVFK